MASFLIAQSSNFVDNLVIPQQPASSQKTSDVPSPPATHHERGLKLGKAEREQRLIETGWQPELPGEQGQPRGMTCPEVSPELSVNPKVMEPRMQPPHEAVLPSGAIPPRSPV